MWEGPPRGAMLASREEEIQKGAALTANFGVGFRGDGLLRVEPYSVLNPEGQSGGKFKGISFGTMCNR